MDATQLLRPTALDATAIAVAGGGEIGGVLAALGASVTALAVDPADEAAAVAAAAALDGPDVLVADARGAFGEAGGGYAGLRAALDGAFLAARVALTECFEPAGRGRIVFVAPAPAAGEHARATRAALDNLTRTLSTEWARLAVTVVLVAPGDATADEDVTALVAYLATPAGAYFSGTTLELS